MNKDSRDQILQAYDEACQLLQFNTFPVFLRYVYRKSKEKLRLLKQARTRVGLEALLMKEPEPSPKQLEATVNAIRAFPYTMRKEIPSLSKELAKKIPHAPGGRPRAFKDQGKRREVCEEILDLVRSGVELKDAQQRVAAKDGVSLKTVQRVWSGRAEIFKQDPPTKAPDS